MKQNAAWYFRPKWPMAVTRKRDRFRCGHPPKTILASIQMFMGGNCGRGRFQFCRPRQRLCLCMVLTLVIHRQLTSLTEIFDGLAQGLHKILPANFGGTADKSRLSGNKSLLGKNDLRKTGRADASARELHVGGNFSLPPTRRRPCFVSYFSLSMESLAENYDRFA